MRTDEQAASSDGEAVGAHVRSPRTRSLLIWLGSFLILTAASTTLWLAMGPRGRSRLQWTPTMANLFAFGTWGFGTGSAILVCWLLVRVLNRGPSWLVWILRGLVLAACGLGHLSLSVVIFSMSTSPASPAAMRIGGVCYYGVVVDDGGYSVDYIYYSKHGRFLMSRTGVSTGETRVSDGEFPPDASVTATSSKDRGDADCPDRSPATSSGTSLSASPGSVNPSAIVASGAFGEWTFGLEMAGAGTSSRAGCTAVASRDGGRTWQRRGAVSADLPEKYFYAVLSGKIQIVGFGSGSDSEAPPVLMTGDGGWTWHSVHLPVPVRTPPSAQFLDSARMSDGAVEVVLNYPSWTQNRGAGQSFVSRDGGATWSAAR